MFSAIWFSGFRTCLVFTLFSLTTCTHVLDDPPNVYRSYQTTIYCNASLPIQMPKNVSEIVQIVNNATAAGQKVKALGSRLSISDTICTDGIPIWMGNINYAAINSDGSATFGAGLELHDAMSFLESHNLSLVIIPTYGGITLGGAIGTGSHGSTLVHPASISDQVIRMTVIIANGSLLTINSPNELNAWRVHLGLLGIVVDVTLKTVPLFKMTIENKPRSDEILFSETVPAMASKFDMFQMWWFPASRKVVMGTGNFVSVETPGNAVSNFISNGLPMVITASSYVLEYLQATKSTIGLNAIAEMVERSLHKEVVGKPPIYSEDNFFIKNPATGYAWRLQSNKCGRSKTGRCAWLNGYENSIFPEESSMAFEISQFAGVTTMVRDVLEDYPASFPMVGIYIRFSTTSPALMAISSERSSFIMEWTTPRRSNPFDDPKDGIAAYQMVLQKMVVEHGGRPHWGKNGLYFTTQNVSKAFPGRTAFAHKMREYDPSGTFLNKFGNRIQGISDDMDIDPRVIHCALQDYCLCSESSDCAASQTCQRHGGFHVCKNLPQQDSLSTFLWVAWGLISKVLS